MFVNYNTISYHIYLNLTSSGGLSSVGKINHSLQGKHHGIFWNYSLYLLCTCLCSHFPCSGLYSEGGDIFRQRFLDYRVLFKWLLDYKANTKPPNLKAAVQLQTARTPLWMMSWTRMRLELHRFSSALHTSSFCCCVRVFRPLAGTLCVRVHTGHGCNSRCVFWFKEHTFRACNWFWLK